MAGELLLKPGKHAKYFSYRKILFHRFFVGLLLFVVVFLVFIVVFNAYSVSPPRTDFHEPVNLEKSGVPVVEIKSDAPLSESRVSNCSYWDCFNVYRCGRGGHDKITIYIYPLKEYLTEDGHPISQLSREFYIVLDTIKRSRYYTSEAEEACLLVPSIDTLNQHRFASKHVSRTFQSLEQ